MDAASLSPAQRHRLLLAAAERRDWYRKLQDRMDAQGWRKHDAAYLAVVAAWEAAHAVVRALSESEPPEPEKPPERPAWWDRGEAPAPPVKPEGLPDLAAQPWVGKRGKSRRRR